MTTDTLKKITGSTTTTTTIYVPDKPVVNPPAIPRIPAPPTSTAFGGKGGGGLGTSSVATGSGTPSPGGGSSGPSGGGGTNYVNASDLEKPPYSSTQIPPGTVIIYPPPPIPQY